MQDAAALPDARHLEMVEAMTECAFELGRTASEIAKRAGADVARFHSATREFLQCFFAMRMGIRLAQAIRAGGPVARTASAAGPRALERAEVMEKPEAPEAPERADAPERLEAERDREGDYEPVSLPRFLKSLGLVAANAERRGDDLPAHVRETVLPTLQTLLRQAKAPPGIEPRSGGAAPTVTVLARPPAVPAARSRLLASTVAPSLPPLRPTGSRRRPSG